MTAPTPRAPIPVPPQQSPFARLAAVHALSIASDAFVTVALAGSIFFSQSVGEARPKTALYLAFTMAPFVVLAPLIGPIIDRTQGGRRLILLATCVGRSLMCVLMANHIKNLLLFPEAFSILVLQKTYAVAKSSIVPSVVDDHTELVKANGRLAIIAGIAGVIGFLPAVLIAKVLGAPWSLRMGALVYIVAALATLQLPREKPEAATGSADEQRELRAQSIFLAASAMALLRGAVGCVTFLLAFSLKRAGQPAWFFGLVIAAATLGGFVGNFLAPPLRKRWAEESMLMASMLAPALIALFAARDSGRVGFLLVALFIALGASMGRIAFDSLVQRDAPDARRGRTFARFETQFQLVWVAGALLGVVPQTLRLGLLIVALALGFGGLSYYGGAHRPTPSTTETPPSLLRLPRRKSPRELTGETPRRRRSRG